MSAGAGPSGAAAGPSGALAPVPAPAAPLVPAATSSVAAAIDMAKHPSGIVPQLQNVVATAYLGVNKLDLRVIAQKCRNAEYNPKRFAACILRITEPRTTCLTFASGKIVVTGARNEEAALQAAKVFGKIIKKADYPVVLSGFTVQNMVGSCDCKFPIRLEGLAAAHPKFASYEPEIFPGLVYRMGSPKICLLIFVSGKVVLTGGKKADDIYTAFEAIYTVLKQFRKHAAPTNAALPAPTAPLALPAPAGAGAGGSQR